MEEEFIYPSELLLLTIWLCSPAILLGLLYLAYIVKRFQIRFLIAGIAVLAFGVLSVVLAIVLWFLTPVSWLPGSLLRGSGVASWLPSFFFPGYVSCIVAAAVTSWAAVKAQQCVQAATRETRSP